MIDIEFFILVLGFFSSLIPLIAEHIILPKKLNKFKKYDLAIYKEHYKNFYNTLFFYLLSTAFGLAIYNYFNPITLYRITEDLIYLVALIIFTLYLISNFEYVDFFKTGILTVNSTTQAHFVFGFVILSVFSFLVGSGVYQMREGRLISGLFIDLPIAAVMFITTLVFVYFYIKQSSQNLLK